MEVLTPNTALEHVLESLLDEPPKEVVVPWQIAGRLFSSCVSDSGSLFI